MSDFPATQLPFFVHPFSRYGSIHSRFVAALPTTLTWVANQAIYMPVTLPWSYPVARVFWANGSTVAAANCDFGIYSLNGTRIYSTGSTVQAGASTLQYVTPTVPFTLPAGRYFFAWNCDSTTSHAYGLLLSTAGWGALMGLLSQAVGAIALPATATFATMPLTVGPVVCGVTRTAVGTAF